MYTDSHTTSHTGDLRADSVYGELKHRLLVGDFPLNVRLGEERLANLVGFSRTPVREALKRLHAEGFVRPGADGGLVPSPPDVDGMRHIYEVRSGLELLALQLPGHHQTVHDPVGLEALRTKWAALRDDTSSLADPTFVYVDESFHESLAATAGNPVLVQMLHQINERIRLVRMQDFLTPDRVAATIEEHLAIVDAVISGDLSEAERYFTAHLAGSIAVVEERVMRALTRMSTGASL